MPKRPQTLTENNKIVNICHSPHVGESESRTQMTGVTKNHPITVITVYVDGSEGRQANEIEG